MHCWQAHNISTVRCIDMLMHILNTIVAPDSCRALEALISSHHMTSKLGKKKTIIHYCIRKCIHTYSHIAHTHHTLHSLLVKCAFISITDFKTLCTPCRLIAVSFDRGLSRQLSLLHLLWGNVNSTCKSINN